MVLNDFNKSKYEILSSKKIDEQNLEVIELCHIKTKAKIILFECSDENKVFNIAFKTPVENAKGIPHILEHSVLCGSRKYDVKDPFVELAKGSMNTFLNAMTFPDKTCYPVASANLKDFHNLVDVYLDAVFYPNAIKNEKIFMQEGWHYETDENDKLFYNGVVFNEMKGVYSDPDSILETSILSNLYSKTNYAYESGGNPSDIINLTYDEFVKFHNTYYSATNSVIYFYGNLDFNYELEYLEREYLSNMKFIESPAKFQDAKAQKKYNEISEYYNIDTKEDKDKHYISISYAIDKEKSTLDNIVMQIIDYVLFSSDSAILKEKFLSKGFGESVYSRYEAGIKNGFYSINVQNVKLELKDKILEEFLNSIKDMIDNGVDVDKFKAGVNSLYFSYAEGEFGRLPRGIYMSLVSLDTYLYCGNAFEFLEYKTAFDYLNKVDLKAKDNIFIKTLKELFIENEHSAINILIPKLNYSNEKEEAFAKIIDEYRNSLSISEFEQIVKESNDLKEYQKQVDTDEKLKCIPVLKVSDIEEKKLLVDFEHFDINGVDAIATFDNDKDIVYMNVGFDISEFSKEEIYLTAIINNVVANIDLKNNSFKDFNNFVDKNTGGLNIKIDVYEKRALFSFGIKSVFEKLDKAFDSFSKVICDTIFKDEKRISILSNESKANSFISILSAGHIAASIRSKTDSQFNSYFADKADLNGIAYYKFISKFCKIYDDNQELINETLDLLYRKIVNSKLYWTISVNKKYYDNSKDLFIKFLGDINVNKPAFDLDLKDKLSNNINEIKKLIDFDSFDKKAKSEAIITPNDINFCSVSGKFDSKYNTGELVLLKTLFNYEYLWTNIRVLGGAYGCMSMFYRTLDYTLVSYRDPNLKKTNEIYYGVSDYLKTANFSQVQINKYIIGSIGSFDNPVSTVTKYKRNTASYFNEITDEEMNRNRSELLNMKASDISKLSNIFSDVKEANRCALISSKYIDEAKRMYESVWQLAE